MMRITCAIRHSRTGYPYRQFGKLTETENFTERGTMIEKVRLMEIGKIVFD